MQQQHQLLHIGTLVCGDSQPAWSSEEERKSDPAVLLVVICCGGEKTGDARRRKAIEGPLPSRETANVMDWMGWDCGGPVTLAGENDY